MASLPDNHARRPSTRLQNHTSIGRSNMPDRQSGERHRSVRRLLHTPEQFQSDGERLFQPLEVGVARTGAAGGDDFRLFLQGVREFREFFLELAEFFREGFREAGDAGVSCDRVLLLGARGCFLRPRFSAWGARVFLATALYRDGMRGRGVGFTGDTGNTGWCGRKARVCVTTHAKHNGARDASVRNDAPLTLKWSHPAGQTSPALANQ